MTSSDMFPKKKKIYVMLDNFKTYNPAKFYDYFEAKIARELIEKFEFPFWSEKVILHIWWIQLNSLHLMGRV
jgi:hypothetical protein